METKVLLHAQTGYVIVAQGPDSLGNYIASCPSVPGCLGYGSTFMDALDSSAKSIEPITAARRRQGKYVPGPDMQITSAARWHASEAVTATATADINVKYAFAS